MTTRTIDVIHASTIAEVVMQVEGEPFPKVYSYAIASDGSSYWVAARVGYRDETGWSPDARFSPVSKPTEYSPTLVLWMHDFVKQKGNDLAHYYRRRGDVVVKRTVCV